MKSWAGIEKKVGETPLQALESFRAIKPELADLPLTYAGRLDPMASGRLLILIGDECKKRKHYDGLDKEYEFEVLLGLKSDSGDVLGLLASDDSCGRFAEKEILEVVSSLVGEYEAPYPAYSSKTVNGKPLFHHAVENNLGEIEIPTSKGRIYKLSFLGKRIIPKDELINSIVQKISMLHVDDSDTRLGSGFRKEEILNCWQMLRNSQQNQFIILKFKTAVSSGTYIRTLAPLLAEKLGTCGLAYSIHRTKIGRFYPIIKSLGFWIRTF